jgi:hypothetical protein
MFPGLPLTFSSFSSLLFTFWQRLGVVKRGSGKKAKEKEPKD